MACLHYSLSLDFLVEKPKGKYNGQKLMVLVIKNTAPRINKIVARSPAIILPRYKPTISTAIKIRIVRSIKPMFFFIFTSLICLITQQRSNSKDKQSVTNVTQGRKNSAILRCYHVAMLQPWNTNGSIHLF